MNYNPAIVIVDISGSYRGYDKNNSLWITGSTVPNKQEVYGTIKSDITGTINTIVQNTGTLFKTTGSIPTINTDFTRSGNISSIDINPIINYGTFISSSWVQNSFVEFNTDGLSLATAIISGSWVGNLSFESTIDGNNWSTVNITTPGVNSVSTLYYVSTPTWCEINVAGYSKIRVRAPNIATTSINSISIFYRGTSTPTSAIIEPVRIQGMKNSGYAPLGSPVVVAGVGNGKVRTLAVNNYGMVASLNAGEAIKSGLVDGKAGNIWGSVTTNSTTEFAVRNTTYTEQLTSSQRSLVSTSVLDTELGTGAKVVRLTYFSYISGSINGPYTEDVTMNGIVAVNTVATNICFVENMEVVQVGSGGVNAGIISIKTTTLGLGSTFASIGVGERQTLYAHHYVPTGITAYIESIYASSTATNANVPRFQARYRDYTIASSAERILFNDINIQGNTGTKQIVFSTPHSVVGPAIIIFYVIPDNGASQINRIAADYFEV